MARRPLGVIASCGATAAGSPFPSSTRWFLKQLATRADTRSGRDATMDAIRRLTLVTLGFGFAAGIVPLAMAFGDWSMGPSWMWLLLAAAFVLAEHTAIHLPLRRSAHSLPLDELPFVIGLVFMPPFGLLTARLVGSAIGVLADRGTTMPRRAFCVAQYGVAAALGILVTERIAPGDGFASPLEWIAVGTGAITAGIVGLTAVLAAVSLSEGLPSRHDLAHAFTTSTAVTVVNASIASLAAFIIVTDPRAAALVLPAGIFCVIGYRAYVDAHRHRAQLELVTELLRSAAIADSPDAALAGILSRTAEALHASTATTILLSSDDENPSWRVVVDNGDVAVTALVVDDTDSLRRDVATDRDGAYRALAATDLNGAALTARLDGERGIVGLLAITGRRASAGPFSRSDQTLLEAVALQAGAIVERTHIERMLAAANERQSQLLYEATHDPLTKLANRRLLLSELEQRIKTGESMSVMLIDLDAFKPINDVYGHTVGDELLCLVAERLLLHTSPDDLVARLGGDEFAIVRRDVSSAIGWREFADQLGAALVDPYIMSVGEVAIGASVGVATSEPGISAGRLLAKADHSMYEAKRLAVAGRTG
jgi:diguanylate cyclase (GGDEF)-like protein